MEQSAYFNFLRFVIQKLRVFSRTNWTVKIYAANGQLAILHVTSRYVTEGRAKMLIRCFLNNDTGAFRQYWYGTEFRVINSKVIG